MSEPITKEELEVNFAQRTSLYNIVNINLNKVVELKQNENDAKPENGSYLHEVFLNSTFGKLEVKGNDEKMQTQGDTINSYPVKHQRTTTEEKLYWCNQCDKEFSRNGNLIRHQRLHTGEKPYQCSQCGNSFSRKNHLIEHQRKHTGEKPYQCSQCDKSFPRKSHLTDHRRTHTGEKPYQCNQCEKAFLTNSKLI
ncbi:unnamed protein product, partial [Meganyctiphanes norvegica]